MDGRGDDLELIEVSVVPGVIRDQRCGQGDCGGGDPGVCGTGLVSLQQTFVSNGGAGRTQAIVRVDDFEIPQVGFQDVGLARETADDA